MPDTTRPLLTHYVQVSIVGIVSLSSLHAGQGQGGLALQTGPG